MRHPRNRKPAPADDKGREPFDAVGERADAEIEALEALEWEGREAAEDARWARSVDAR